MELVVKQQIYYSNKQLVPMKEVAESLLALEAVIRHSPQVLEALFPGTTIDAVDVFIKELRSESIWEDVVIKFVFGSQKKFDQFIENVRERVGMDNIVNNPQLLSAIILVLILSGGAYYLGKDAPEQRATIEANNNTIINIGAGMVEMSAEEFQVVVEAAIKDKPKLAKDAVRVVKPAKLDPTASITFSDNEKLQITPEAVRAMPRYMAVQEEEQFIEDFKKIEMELRATDLDSTKRGWAVVVPQLSERRVRLQLDPTVNPEELYERRKFTANATIIFGHDKEYKKIPKLVFLREIVR
ncbi:hypothetical protein [Thioalkalivibrio paradoxus]|uniref:Uncharacterized protein n=1 Tax=Thioalkalivibrio paradoxus ARh 1 TaxID=713585 RepID=W0DJC2_9GAMM|nr:hypothetical protein [Thioalkalivibrio paradoxus]AHE97103.1 hypothetical protein THITH_01110 [Thioalkalivibrio paradoxus ARh 1]